jgi:RHS repeat-associated protein
LVFECTEPTSIKGYPKVVYNPRFPGQYYDVETGLNYNAYRDYDPAVGRYIESDPIGLAGGSFSTYAYVYGNPLSNYDRNGQGAVGTAAIQNAENAVRRSCTCK